MDKHAARQIEEALVGHYLRSDGPYGNSPVRFLDVTDEHLGAALRGLVSGSDIKSALIGSFSPLEVKDAFALAKVSAIGSEDAPGWFRYLILSCVVFSLDEEDVASFDFGVRLQQIFGISVIDRRGLRHLWGRLERWLAHRADQGLPFRRISLPVAPDSMRNIGISAHLTFPSWRDIARLQRLFEGVPEEELRRTSQTIGRIALSALKGSWSPGFIAAFEDFRAKNERGLRLIATHPFYQVVRRVARNGQTADDADAARIALETDFDGYDEYRMVDGDGVDRCYADFDEVAQDLAGRSLRGPYAGLVRGLNDGVIPFDQGEVGDWQCTREPSTPRVRLAARKDLAARLALDLPEGRGWGVTAPMSWEQAVAALARIRPSSARQEEIVEPSWDGGVRVGRAAFLGRPGFLPSLSALPDLSVSIVSRRSGSGNLEFAGAEGSKYYFGGSGPLAGTWDVRLHERGEFAGDARISLMPDAHEFDFRNRDRSAAGWIPEPSLEGPLAPTFVRHSDVNAARPAPAAIADLLEAIYSRASSGWSERELVELLSAYFQRQGVGSVEPRRAAWEALDVLSGAGWIQAVNSTTWRSRRWLLVRPSLVHWPQTGCVLLEGAVGAIVSRRFEAVVERMGGTVNSTVGTGFSIPLSWASVDDADALAAEMDLPLIRPFVELPVVGQPAELSRSAYTDRSRSCTAAWSWQGNHFYAVSAVQPPPGGQVQLQRLRHDGDRSADIYVVKEDGKSAAYYESKTSALIDAHRRAEVALFQLDAVECVVRRSGGAGHLPEPLERLSRYRHLQGPSLLFREGRCVLEYPLAAQDVSAISSWLGEAVAVVEARHAPEHAMGASIAVLGRRRKLRVETAGLVRRSA
jgi:hypothetical protein